MMGGGGGGVLLLWLAVLKGQDVKGSEARPTSYTFHRCLDPGTFRSNIDSKTYQIWQSPQVPKAPNAKCPKMSQKLGVSRQASPYLSSTSKQSIPRYTKRHLSLPSLHSTTQTHLQRVTLIKTIPSPPTTLHLTPTIQPTIHSPKCPSLNHHLNHRHPSPPSPKNSPPSSSWPSPSRPSRH